MKKLCLFLILFLLCAQCQAVCIAQWKLNDNAASAVVVDSIGTHTGTYYDENTPATVTTDHNAVGQINGALDFDGTNDYVDVGNVIGTGAYTKVAWVKRADGANYNNIISTGNADYSHVFWAPYTYSFKLSAGNMGMENVQDDDALAVGVWYFVAVTFDPAVESGKMVLYKDGVPVDTATSVPTQSSSPKTYIGRYNTGYLFKGTIDNVMIFDHELNQAQINRLYNSGNGTESVSLAAAGTRRYRGRRR